MDTNCDLLLSVYECHTDTVDSESGSELTVLSNESFSNSIIDHVIEQDTPKPTAALTDAIQLVMHECSEQMMTNQRASYEKVTRAVSS